MEKSKKGQNMKRRNIFNWVLSNGLLVGTVLGVLVGVAAGLSLRPLNLSQTSQQLLSYPGELFTRALQMMILPLIVSSLIVGSASLNAKMNGTIALRTLAYFVSTSFLNALLGVILAVLIHPGNYVVKDHLESTLDFVDRKNTLLDNFLDLGRNIVPSNIFAAVFQQSQTVYTTVNGVDYMPKVEVRDGTNTLGIIFFSLLFGSILGSVGDKAKPLIEAFGVIDHVIMRMVTGVMWLTPFGVASIITSKLLSIDDVTTVTTQLGLFVLTVLIGVLTYQLVIQQVIYFVIKRKNPFIFYAGMTEAVVTAFSTASAAVSLPITFRCVEKQKIDPRIAHFILPIGATVNKDGTALFVTVASIFLAQMNGINLGFGDLITVAICSTAVSIASASIPSASLALMFIVLNSVGAPTSEIGLLFAVDWLVDRIRTTNNLLGDCYAAAIVEHFSKKELEEMDVFKSTNSNSKSCEQKISSSSEMNSQVQVLQSYIQTNANINILTNSLTCRCRYVRYRYALCI